MGWKSWTEGQYLNRESLIHLWYSLLCEFPEIALQKLNEQKYIYIGRLVGPGPD